MVIVAKASRSNLGLTKSVEEPVKLNSRFCSQSWPSSSGLEMVIVAPVVRCQLSL